jgi:hypothetical protein
LHLRDHRDRHDLVYELHCDHRDVMGVTMKMDDC